MTPGRWWLPTEAAPLNSGLTVSRQCQQLLATRIGEAAESVRAKTFTTSGQNLGVRASCPRRCGSGRVSDTGADRTSAARSAAGAGFVKEAAASARRVAERGTYAWKRHAAVCRAGEAITAKHSWVPA